jgi:hypothetical protein
MACPAGSDQIEDVTAIHLGVELEVEVIQLLVGNTELDPFVTRLSGSLLLRQAS